MTRPDWRGPGKAVLYLILSSRFSPTLKGRGKGWFLFITYCQWYYVVMDTFYEKRDRVLKLLGYSSYTEYLESELWAKIRAKVLNSNNGKCRLCRDPATVVHHRNYKPITMKGVGWKKSLIPLCNKCHYRLEFDGDVKTPGANVDAKYLEKKRKIKKHGMPWIGLAHKAKHLARRGR